MKRKNEATASPESEPDIDLPIEADDEERGDPTEGHRWVDSAAALDDYLEEEVVDVSGKSVGTLSCYWEGTEGELVYCGISIEGEDNVRVVPGIDAQTSERFSWVRLNYPAAKVRTAPVFECDEELSPEFEQMIYKHFGVAQPKREGTLKYLSTKG